MNYNSLLLFFNIFLVGYNLTYFTKYHKSHIYPDTESDYDPLRTNFAAL